MAAHVSEPLVIGLGGNVGSEVVIVERFGLARAALSVLGSVWSAPVFRSAAIGPTQPAYLNTAVRVARTDATPDELIATLLEVEGLLGRDRAREVRWGPRTIDLDVLVWGARTLRTPALEVPHPRLAERKFALAPLVAVVGAAFVVPGLGAAGDLLERVAGQACEELAGTW